MARPLQYKDTDLVLNEILRLRTACWSDADIMRFLNLDYSTYYRYKKKMLEIMQPLIAEKRHELVAAELQMTQDRLESLYRKLQETIDNPATRAKERIDAIETQHKIAIDIAKLQVEAPKVLANHEAAVNVTPPPAKLTDKEQEQNNVQDS